MIKRYAFLLAFLLFAPSLFAQTLTYPGQVFIATTPETCMPQNNTIKSWHWQCAGSWKPWGDVVSTDVIATCDTPSTDLSQCANTGNNRRWKWVSTLTITSNVMACSVTPTSPPTSWSKCPQTPTSKAFYLVSGAAFPGSGGGGGGTPPPPPPPPAGEAGQTTLPATGLRFRNTTATAIPGGAPTVLTNFDAEWVHANGGKCWDAFIGTHSDYLGPSTLFLQNEVEGACAGTFTLLDNATSQYTQPAIAPRCTSRYIWGPWYENPFGIWSFFCHDVDGNAAARYIADPVVEPGQPPQYLPKEIGCPGAGMACTPVSWGITGDMMLVSTNRSYTNPQLGRTFDMTTKADLFTTFQPLLPWSSGMTVMDIDPDGTAEVLVPPMGGYFRFHSEVINEVEQRWLQWFPDTITGPLPPLECSSGHTVPMDIDTDGDFDFIMACPAYSAIGADAVEYTLHGPEQAPMFVFMNNGDGTFSNDTANHGVGTTTLKGTWYHSIYANSVGADFNNDGNPEFLYGGEARAHLTNSSFMAILDNNNGMFTANRNNNFGPSASATNASGRAAVGVADYDADGKIDIIRTQGKSSPTHDSIGIWRNETDTANNRYLSVQVRGPGRNYLGLGSTVIVRDPANNDVITSGQVGYFHSGYKEAILHLGTAQLTEVTIDVILSNERGSCHFENVATNAALTIGHLCTME
jgi:hypothetical protein